jgi:hypothetical protein
MEQYSLSGNINIPTDDQVPDLSTAVPLQGATDTSANGSPDMPSHVAAEVPQASLTTIETARIALPAAPAKPVFYPANIMGWQ